MLMTMIIKKDFTRAKSFNRRLRLIKKQQIAIGTIRQLYSKINSFTGWWLDDSPSPYKAQKENKLIIRSNNINAKEIAVSIIKCTTRNLLDRRFRINLDMIILGLVKAGAYKFINFRTNFLPSHPLIYLKNI